MCNEWGDGGYEGMYQFIVVSVFISFKPPSIRVFTSLISLKNIINNWDISTYLDTFTCCI